jgi:hypothetical protein
MKKLSLFTLICALALPLVASVRPAAAAEVKVVASATGDNDPFVFTWIDSADGKLSVSAQASGVSHAAFAGAQYLFTEQGSIIIGRLQGQDLKMVVPMIAEAHNETGTFYVAHLRTPDKTLFVDGTIRRYEDDPAHGFAQFNLLMVAKDGSTISTLIQQDLTFAGNNPGPNNPGQ